MSEEKSNETNDEFNLSNEDIINCFGSQIRSQSSDSKYNYKDGYITNDIKKKKITEHCKKKNLGKNPKKYYFKKDDILRNICHGFIDTFFSQKEELREIKYEIKKLQNLLVNNNNVNHNDIESNSKTDLTFNQNNSFNNNEIYNYILKNSKKNNTNLNINYSIKEEHKNFINLQKRDNKKGPKGEKTPNIRGNPRAIDPETIDEEINENENAFQNDIFEENEDFNFEDIKDDKFDEILKGRKSKKITYLIRFPQMIHLKNIAY